MTPKETKELAEKAAEFLKSHCALIYGGYLQISINHHTAKYLYPSKPTLDAYFFLNPHTAPILMHLAQVEMEKRGFKWESSKFIFYTWCFIKVDDGIRYKSQDADNKFIAFWSAVMGAVK